MIQRDPRYYMTGYTGEDPYQAPFYLRALVFDGKEGDFNTRMVDAFNSFLEEKRLFLNFHLSADREKGQTPKKIIVINASHDDLPTSYETARIFEDLCEGKGLKIPAKVVNTRDELMSEIEKDPSNTLVMSQCVNKNVYNVDLSVQLEKK